MVYSDAAAKLHLEKLVYQEHLKGDSLFDLESSWEAFYNDTQQKLCSMLRKIILNLGNYDSSFLIITV